MNDPATPLKYNLHIQPELHIDAQCLQFTTTINGIVQEMSRLRFLLFVPKRRRTPAQAAQDERNLRAEGYLIVTTRCRRCGAEERAAIFPCNVLKPGECGKCHHFHAEVTEVLP